MNIKFSVIQTVVDAIFLYLLFKGWQLGIQFGMKLMVVDILPVRIFVGVIGVTIALAMFSVLKSTILAFIRSCRIYCICNKEVSTISEAIFGTVERFSRVICVILFNYVIRNVLKEIKEVVSNTDFSGDASSVTNILQSLVGAFPPSILRLLKPVLSVLFDYVDECILAYTIVHDELSLAEAAKRGFVLFVKNTASIFGRIVTLSLFHLFLRVIYYIVFIMVWVRLCPISVYSVVIGYIIARFIAFIISDAWLEPFMMYSTVEEFIGHDDNDQSSESCDSVLQQLESIIPALGQISDGSFSFKKNTSDSD